MSRVSEEDKRRNLELIKKLIRTFSLIPRPQKRPCCACIRLYPKSGYIINTLKLCVFLVMSSCLNLLALHQHSKYLVLKVHWVFKEYSNISMDDVFRNLWHYWIRISQTFHSGFTGGNSAASLSCLRCRHACLCSTVWGAHLADFASCQSLFLLFGPFRSSAASVSLSSSLESSVSLLLQWFSKSHTYHLA